MASVSVDLSEVRTLATDLRGVEPRLSRHIKPAIAKGAGNIKSQLREEASNSRHFRMANHISYDLLDGGFGAEIGPEKVGAGNLANIAYFGGANGGGGTVPDPRGALDAEAPRFLSELARLAVEAVLP